MSKLALSIPTNVAFTMFNINMGEACENIAREENREMTDREKALYDSNLWTARRVHGRSKLNLSALSPKELKAAQKREQAARALQLAELVQAQGILNVDDEDPLFEGKGLAEQLDEPLFMQTTHLAE